MKRKAFTLVELLVVVGVIGLLATMLVPSLSEARDVARSAVCKNQLKQLWEVLHAGDPDRPMNFPAAAGWLQWVHERGAGGMTQCPADNDPRPDNFILEDIWLEQLPDGHGDHSSLVEILFNGKHHPDPGYHQIWLEVFQPGTEYEIRYVNPPAVERGNAHSILHVTFKHDHIVLESLNPEDYGYGLGGCMSDVFVWRGDDMSKDEELLRLTGINYRQIDPRSPVELANFPGSYAYNEWVPSQGARPRQIVLMDYLKTIARPEEHGQDWEVVVDGVREYKYLAPRHRGRVNGVYVDGSVSAHWPEALDPGGEVWQP